MKIIGYTIAMVGGALLTWALAPALGLRAVAVAIGVVLVAIGNDVSGEAVGPWHG